MTLSPALRALVSFLHVMALCLCVGAPVFFAAAVVPALFHSFASPGPAIGSILTTLDSMLEGGFAVAFVTTWLLTASRGPSSRANVILRRVPVLAFFAAMVSSALVTPAVERLRAAGQTASPAFVRLHRFSVLLLAIDVLSALGLAGLTAWWISSGQKGFETAASPPTSPAPPNL